MNPTYFCKINSPFKRDNKGRFTDEWSDPRFEELKDEQWQWYYKYDGTSVGCLFDEDGKVHIFGRGTKTLMPDWQKEAVLGWADDIWSRTTPFRAVAPGKIWTPGLHVYAELVGPKVQGNPHGFNQLTVMEFARGVPGELPWPTNPFYELHTLSSVFDSFYLGGDYPCQRPALGKYEGVVGWHPSGVWTKLKVKDKWE